MSLCLYIDEFSIQFDMLNSIVNEDCQLPIELKYYIWAIYKYKWATSKLSNLISREIRCCSDCKQRTFGFKLKQIVYFKEDYCYKYICLNGCLFTLKCGCNVSIKDSSLLMSDSIKFICCERTTVFELNWNGLSNENVIHIETQLDSKGNKIDSAGDTISI